VLLTPVLAKKALTEEQLRPIFAGIDFKVASNEEIKKIHILLTEQGFHRLKETHLLQYHVLKISYTSESQSSPSYYSESIMSQELKHKSVTAI
jgi:hypothetical protein